MVMSLCSFCALDVFTFASQNALTFLDEDFCSITACIFLFSFISGISLGQKAVLIQNLKVMTERQDNCSTPFHVIFQCNDQTEKTPLYHLIFIKIYPLQKNFKT